MRLMVVVSSTKERSSETYVGLTLDRVDLVVAENGAKKGEGKQDAVRDLIELRQ